MKGNWERKYLGTGKGRGPSMNRLLAILGFIVLSLPALAADEKITWEHADGVLAKSAATGKPVIWYFVNNQFSKDASPVPVATDAADKAFANPVIVKRRETFLWVRGDQTRATAFKVQGAPGIVVTDSDGDVLLGRRSPVRRTSSTRCSRFSRRSGSTPRSRGETSCAAARSGRGCWSSGSTTSRATR
jgi:hypothetical protein